MLLFCSQLSDIYRLLHRKCAVMIFIHELQNFGKRTSERSKRASLPKFCNEWIKIITYHFLCCNLFIIYIKKNKTACIGSQLSVRLWLSKQSYTKRWWLAIFFTCEESYMRRWLDVSLSSHVKYKYRILFAAFIA